MIWQTIPFNQQYALVTADDFTRELWNKYLETLDYEVANVSKSKGSVKSDPEVKENEIWFSFLPYHSILDCFGIFGFTRKIAILSSTQGNNDTTISLYIFYNFLGVPFLRPHLLRLEEEEGRKLSTQTTVIISK